MRCLTMLSVQLSEATARLIGRPVTRQDRFGLAVSGGADSMAMLALAHPLLARADRGRNGRSRTAPGSARGSADGCGLVRRPCVPHATLSPAEPISGSLQAQARAARYTLLEQWRIEHGLDWLLTAHQADDQLEHCCCDWGGGLESAGLRLCAPGAGPF